MSSVLSSAAASATASSCSTADFTQFPTQDVACAVGSTQGIPSNTSDVLKSCCKSAPVESFNGECGWYCLSVDQAVADLLSCFMEGGVSSSSVFCNSNNTATATSKPDKTGSATASGTGSSTGAEESKGAAPAVFAPQGVSKTGLGVLAMIVVSTFAGALL
ncbi:hypothetical protein P153DRAFT_383608 [Dothidotthia symphoricarpi CBS 119687]|uniref:Uncharacterized protein n=1 Tax=Dothidotthia symphoricarpi CBS 119687 TaxID=1392245 RepID=A0A6A6AK70_9PLEO|nr:uncharacterized protein P153DRAFT_383608 [Dothidotthia symphoricarpi CBS 119687]KAF2131508.1 hypothetical protein P153DRAFT_383608 [Dothidotthia symphoricarpi CBS 119687]